MTETKRYFLFMTTSVHAKCAKRARSRIPFVSHIWLPHGECFQIRSQTYYCYVSVDVDWHTICLSQGFMDSAWRTNRDHDDVNDRGQPWVDPATSSIDSSQTTVSQLVLRQGARLKRVKWDHVVRTRWITRTLVEVVARDESEWLPGTGG